MNKSAISNLFSSQTITPSSWLTIVFSLVLAFAVGLFIAFIYRRNYRGVMYSNNFVLTLILMTLITTPVVMCIKESIQLSMGMVGALSIVRFRTAVKDPLDTAYMFWALTMGILLGAGQFSLAILVTILIAVLIFVLNRISFKGENSFLMVVTGTLGSESNLEGILKKAEYARMKSKTINANGFEMTYEVRLKAPDAYLSHVQATAGVTSATLVAYQNETT